AMFSQNVQLHDHRPASDIFFGLNPTFDVVFLVCSFFLQSQSSFYGAMCICQCATIMRLVYHNSVPNRRSLSGRIVGGEETEIENYPYQLSLEYFYIHNCGASIISNDWALTAAHCLQNKHKILIRLRAGSSTRGEGGTLHSASEIIVHPNHNNKTQDCDIAVIKVGEPFVYGPTIQPISLVTTEPSVGDLATVTGWGLTSVKGSLSSQLKVVFIPIIDHYECISDYLHMYSVTNNMICAANEESGQDACNADSGGPMVIGGKQVGIVSWGESCGDPKYPGVYTNIALLRDFVVNTTGIE
ncbi:hypothetical protein L9F63_011262, partial [Diploptera punctata]